MNVSVKEKSKACVKKQSFLGFPVNYKGTIVEANLPEYFIEVTPNLGSSVFSALPNLAAHLTSAAALSGISPTENGGKQPGHSYIHHARIIDIPFARAALEYPIGSQISVEGLFDLEPWFVPEVAGIPAGFKSISEYLGEWYDPSLKGEAGVALALAPATFALCQNPLGQAINVLDKALEDLGAFSSNIDTSNFSLPDAAQYAFKPVPGQWEAGMLNPGSELMQILAKAEPFNMCVGTYESKFPRSGYINISDRQLGAIIAASRFASLSADIYMNHNLRIEKNDLLQQIYPPPIPGTDASCFTPGHLPNLNQILVDPIGAMNDTFLGAEDGIARETELPFKQDYYLFAVWKRREACTEPLSKEAIKQVINTSILAYTEMCAIAP